MGHRYSLGQERGRSCFVSKWWPQGRVHSAKGQRYERWGEGEPPSPWDHHGFQFAQSSWPQILTHQTPQGCSGNSQENHPQELWIVVLQGILPLPAYFLASTRSFPQPGSRWTEYNDRTLPWAQPSHLQFVHTWWILSRWNLYGPCGRPFYWQLVNSIPWQNQTK